jgi:hypothetical protein
VPGGVRTLAAAANTRVADFRIASIAQTALSDLLPGDSFYSFVLIARSNSDRALTFYAHVDSTPMRAAVVCRYAKIFMSGDGENIPSSVGASLN